MFFILIACLLDSVFENCKENLYTNHSWDQRVNVLQQNSSNTLYLVALIAKNIVIIRNWLGNPANFKGTNKDPKIYVGRSTTLHNLLFCAHTLGLNCVTVTFLLVSSSGINYDLLCLCRVMAKKANKNIEQSFLTIYLY